MPTRAATLCLIRALGGLWLIGLAACGDDAMDPTAAPAAQSLTGHVLYCGSRDHFVSDVIVRLEADGVVYTDTTDASGAFAFDSVPVSPSEQSWSFAKEMSLSDRPALAGTDATLLFYAVEGIVVLHGCSFLAADVNLDGLVDLEDATALANWLASSPNTHQVGTWVFELVPVDVGNDQPFEVRASAYILGDVNLSWSPSP